MLNKCTLLLRQPVPIAACPTDLAKPKGVGFYPEQTLPPWHPARSRRKDGAQILCMDFPQTRGHTEVPERRGQGLFLDVEPETVS